MTASPRPGATRPALPPSLPQRPSPQAPYRVLMVCMGNICRSPTAEGVLAHRAALAGQGDRLQVDSAGTHDYHVGAPPDGRAQAHALRRGVDLSGQRARQLKSRDFHDFDLVLVMDDRNERAARALCAPADRAKLRRLTDFCRHHGADEVPDPYYGDDAGFEHVLDLIEDACDGLIAALKASDAPAKGE